MMTAKTWLATLGLGALLLGVTASDASAHGWRGRHRHPVHHRPVVRVVRPVPVVVRPAPVYVAPAPVVVAPPAPVYRPAPVVVAPPAPVVVAPAPRRW